MRKRASVLPIAAFITALFTTAAAFAQEAQEPSLKISGEVKTGIYWQQVQDQGKAVVTDGDTLKMHSTDDAGDHEGRFRVNLDYDNGNSFGMKARIEWENWSNTDSEQPLWTYAFGYGNFFEDRLTVSAGKLGASPWGTDEPDLWRELEHYNNGGGMRIEWKPGFISVGHLNVGFVLNWFDGNTGNATRTAGFLDLLRESVVGVAYTHDLFHARFAYRLDSDLDYTYDVDVSSDPTLPVYKIYGTRGDEFIYRLEERLLNDILPGMKIWAVGWYRGLFAEDDSFYNFKNWVYAEYDPPELFGLPTPFTAQLRFGLDYVGADYDDDFPEYDYVTGFVARDFDFIEPGPRAEFHVSPSFYWHFFDKLLSVGAMFSYRQDLGENKIWPGSPYQQIELEPKVQLNLSTSYIALAYNFKKEYILGDYPERKTNDPTRQTSHINLRFCIYY